MHSIGKHSTKTTPRALGLLVCVVHTKPVFQPIDIQHTLHPASVLILYPTGREIPALLWSHRRGRKMHRMPNVLGTKSTAYTNQAKRRK